MKGTMLASLLLRRLVILIVLIPPILTGVQVVIYGVHSLSGPSLLRMIVAVLLTTVVCLVMYRKIRSIEENLRTLSARRERFFETVTHDLKSPLASIKMCVDLMLSDGHFVNVEQKEMLERMGRRSAEMAKFIDDLLFSQAAQSGLLPLNKQPVQLQKHVTDLIRSMDPLIKKQGVNIAINVDALTCFCDPTRLSQILTNLISNALKHSRVGGVVEIEARLQGPDVVFAVCDSGPGIPADKLKAIFEPFEMLNTRATGHGLGLTIVRDLVAAHGGIVWVESELGRGAKFYFKLPCADTGHK